MIAARGGARHIRERLYYSSCTHLVNAMHGPSDFEPSSAVVYSDFVTVEEGDSLAQDVANRMKRRRYEKGHWDAVISDYKEVELGSDLSSLSVQALERCKHRLLSRHLKPTSTFLPCHAIDLKQAGQLTAHVDSVKFSGTMVAGLSLLSSSIMRLRVEDRFVDLLLPPRSLYVLTGKSRYEYTHELLPCGSTFTRGDDGSERQIKREQRVSIIFRDAKVE